MEGNKQVTYEEEEDDDNDLKKRKQRASWSQRIVLEKVFQENQYPDQATRIELGKKLGMSSRKVQIWFQNRRTKAKTVPNEDQHHLHLLVQGVDVKELNSQQTSTGNTLLLISIAMDHTAVHTLLSKGVDCNIANHLGWTPLYTAVVHNHKHLVEILLTKKYNVDPNCQEKRFGESPLHLAALRGLDSIANILLTRSDRIDVNIRDREDRTPLHHACVHGNTEIVKGLLVRQASVSATSKQGLTPLHCAALAGKPEIVHMLIKQGSSVNATDLMGYSPLHFAAREKRRDAVVMMLSAGANTHIVSSDGLTALHLAVLADSLPVVQALVESGASITQSTFREVSPYNMAMVHQRNSIVEFFNQKMKS